MSNENNNVEFIDNIIANLKELKKEIKKKTELSEKCMNADPFIVGRNKYQKMTTDLNFQCMYVLKRVKSIARQFNNSFLDVDIEESEVSPSSFHNYKI